MGELAEPRPAPTVVDADRISAVRSVPPPPRRLVVGAANDAAEQAADDVAAKVIAALEHPRRADRPEPTMTRIRRATVAPEPVVRRFHDPESLKDEEGRVAAVEYLWAPVGQTTRLASLLNDYRNAAYDHETADGALLAKITVEVGGGAVNNIAKLLEWAVAGKQKAGILAQPKSADAVKVAVRVANVLEQEVATLGAVSSMSPGTALVGTEFTFTSPMLSKVKLSEPHTKADQLIEQWRAAVKDNKPTPVIGPHPKPKSPVSFKFTYTLGDTSTWWWSLDVDEGCLETQTAPTTQEGLRGSQIKKIIDEHIFGVATTDLGLVVDSTASGGGGHLSLDASTTFGGSVEVLLAVLSRIQASRKAWEVFFGYVDAPNAPWLDDQRADSHSKPGTAHTAMLSTVAGILAGLEKGAVDPKLAADQLIAWNKKVVNPEAEERSRDKDNDIKKGGQDLLASPLHYQAVNLEHLADKDEGKRRIELRAVGAQQSGAQLQQQLTYVFNLIDEVRSEVQETQAKRIESRKS